MDEEEIILEVKRLHTIFCNNTNRYIVVRFVTYDANEEDFTATGYFSELGEGVLYRPYGDYVDHPRYGMQFQVVAYKKMMPNDESTLIRYSSNSLFPGIGVQTAKSIVEAFEEDAIEIIKESPETLKQITALDARKRASTTQGIMEHEEVGDSVVFFMRMGTSVKTIMKMEAACGETMIPAVRENPYCLIEEIDGIGFKTADKLAKELAFAEDHPYHTRAVILSCVLGLCMASGNTYTTPEQAQKRFCKEFDASVEIVPYLEELELDRLVMIEDGRIYHYAQYNAQNGIASLLAEFLYREPEEGVSLDVEDIGIMEQKFYIRYEDKQKEATTAFFKEPFLILTGGPRTREMTIVKGTLDLYQHHYPSDIVALCTPTGRATKRLSGLSPAAATTIHSLLKWGLKTNTFLVNDRDPVQADLLITDELSMVDQWLFYHLLRACRMVKRVVVIGDEDQLFSIGCGCVLKDPTESVCFPLVRLDKIFRQGEGSDVATLVRQIREGSVDTLDHAKDVASFPCQNYEAHDPILSVISNTLDKGYNPKEIQVLAPVHDDVAGIDTLNNALQKMMNPSDSYKKELKIDYRLFYEHSKILQLKSQPEDEAYNEDIGEIIEISYRDDNVHQRNRITADFDGVPVRYSGKQIYNITHACATFIHKVQGSECAIVIVPTVKDCRYMLQKRLIHTGASRAKRSPALLGDKEVFLYVLCAESRRMCRSTLQEKIKEMMG